MTKKEAPRPLTPGERLNELDAGKFTVMEKLPLGGSLEARKLRAGRVFFYWRYTADSKTEREPIGPYDSLAPPKSLKPSARGYSYQAALRRANDLATENVETPGGIRAGRERQALEAAAVADALAAREKYTLRALCEAYRDWLKDTERSSHVQVTTIFTRHLYEPFPELVTMPANEVRKDHVIPVLRRLTQGEDPKRTTARKLRAYLHAAFAAAKQADSDTDIPQVFAEFKVTSNPIEQTAAVRSQADKNPLSVEQLRAYWKALKLVKGEIGAALRLHLLLGGQRPAQLVRVQAADFLNSTIRQLDGKGRRNQAREHLLPVTERIRTELKLLPAEGFAFSTDGGKTPMHPSNLSKWSQNVAQTLEGANRIDGFQLKRVRSGVETALAQARVHKDHRAQLQSHGVGGVQATHYDAWEYLDVKREALEALYELLEPKASAQLQLVNGEVRAA